MSLARDPVHSDATARNPGTQGLTLISAIVVGPLLPLDPTQIRSPSISPKKPLRISVPGGAKQGRSSRGFVAQKLRESNEASPLAQSQERIADLDAGVGSGVEDHLATPFLDRDDDKIKLLSNAGFY